MKKKLSALLLAAVLCLGLVSTAFAEGYYEYDPDNGPQWVEDEKPEEKPEEKPDDKPKPDDRPSSDRDDSSRDRGNSVSVSTRIDHGTVRVSPNNAEKGETVTITVRPDEGYELDKLTVKDARGNEISVKELGDNKFSFIMPGTKVSVDATFVKIGAQTPSAGFTDVPASHAFYGDITWVASQGYMGGYSDGSFRPGANTTRQALWMVLARIDGANPSDMSAARRWATTNGVSDGSNPGGAMTRQQMVTMLYRYAQSKGYKITGGVSLSNFTDASGVADYARDAMSWAVGNGIVQGTGNGALNPGGTATRAHFAAFLHRFCTSAGIA